MSQATTTDRDPSPRRPRRPAVNDATVHADADRARREAERMRHLHDAIRLERELAAEAEARRARSASAIIWGLVLLVVGLGITLVTYDAASTSGGTYVIAYGPIVVGVINIIRGVAMRA